MFISSAELKGRAVVVVAVTCNNIGNKVEYEFHMQLLNNKVKFIRLHDINLQTL